MAVTLLALYRRPEGGDEALQTFLRRYADEHLPLIRQTPGLLALDVAHVRHAFQESDLVTVTTMQFDDRESLDAGLASDPMRAAGRNLREIAPGLVTLLVLDPDHELSHVEVADAASRGGDPDSGPSTQAADLEGDDPAEGRSDAPSEAPG